MRDINGEMLLRVFRDKKSQTGQLVAARTKKEACEVINCTAYHCMPGECWTGIKGMAYKGKSRVFFV